MAEFDVAICLRKNKSSSQNDQKRADAEARNKAAAAALPPETQLGQLISEVAESRVQAKLSELKDASRLFKEASKALGPLDVLVNCAAADSQSVADLPDISEDLWSSTMTTNVDAPMLLSQLFAAQEVVGKKGGGSIINISSIEGSRPAPGHSHYATSKAALEMLTKASALEFGSRGIRVNAIAPGLINRAGIEEGWPEGVAAWKAAAPLGRLVDPFDIASTCVFLASPMSSSISGTVLTVDCGLSIKPGW